MCDEHGFTCMNRYGYTIHPWIVLSQVNVWKGLWSCLSYSPYLPSFQTLHTRIEWENCDSWTSGSKFYPLFFLQLPQVCIEGLKYLKGICQFTELAWDNPIQFSFYFLSVVVWVLITTQDGYLMVVDVFLLSLKWMQMITISELKERFSPRVIQREGTKMHVSERQSNLTKVGGERRSHSKGDLSGSITANSGATLIDSP